MARDRAARPEARPLRLFVAADVPPEVAQQLKEAIDPLREAVQVGRWTFPENWHVTLKFLGSTYPRLVDWVRESVAAVAGAHPPFATSLDGLGAFPSPRRARVLWAGLDDPAPGFASIAARLDDALEREFRPERRPLTPHLTVARFDPPVGVAEALDRTGGDVWSEAFPVDRIVLYRSHLRRPAPIYEPLDEFPLGG
jgi:RNA 2',3'-cyclic 3'-phosphodiesterase